MARFLSALLLLSGAIAVLASPELTYRLLAFSPLQEPSVDALDELSSGEDRSSPRFLAERNQVHLVLDQSMTLGQFLHLYQIGDPGLRLQILEQLGLETIQTEHPLEEGTELHLRLTPEASANR